MPVLIDNTGKTGILIPGGADLSAHGVEEIIRPDDRLQLTLNIHRHRADDPDIAGERVQLHIRKEKLFLILRPDIPWPLPHRKRL